MKFLIKNLPDRKHYKPDANNQSNWYKFIDAQCPRVRFVSKIAYPWDEDKLIIMPELLTGKSDNSEYSSKLNLKIFPYHGENLKPVELHREIYKGHFPHMKHPCYMFDAFPVDYKKDEPLLWLIYYIPA